jgi:di/tricarboxylate transporter
VIDVDSAYRAVSWRTVALLAGLIPLGLATQKTGAATYLGGQLFGLLEGMPVLVILFALGLLATALSLTISNVAATVVLVPLFMHLATLIDVSPEGLALLAALCAQNSFVLPTNQVNALLMAPGGYRTRDYLKAGGLVTAMFLPIAVLSVYLIWC